MYVCIFDTKTNLNVYNLHYTFKFLTTNILLYLRVLYNVVSTLHLLHIFKKDLK